jgi:hypothetical protein
MLVSATVVVWIGLTTITARHSSPEDVQAAVNHALLVGPGFADVSPHQLVRTSTNVLYVVAPTCDAYPSCPGNSLRVYAADQAGTPTSFTERDAAHRPTAVGSTSIAIDGADTIHIAWNDRGGNLSYGTFSPATGLWTSTAVVAPTGWTTFGQGDEGVALALDAVGIPHVAFTSIVSGIRRVSYTHKIGGVWSSPTVVDDAPIGSNQGAWHPTLAFYPNGDLLLAWFVGSFNATPDGTIYFRVRGHLSGAWAGHTTIADDTLWTSIDNGPSLLITADGTAHVTFLNAGTATSGSSTMGDYIHHYYNSGSGWIANHPGGGTQITHDPSLGPGPNGSLRIYGHGWQGGRIDGHGDDLYFFEGSGTGAWGSWTLYATGAFDSSVSTRWAQFFQAFPQTLDIMFWADPYPNIVYVGTDVGVSGVQPPTQTPAPTATQTSTPSATSTATLTATATLAAVLCVPRPRIDIQATRAAFGRLQVTISSTVQPSTPNNRLRRIRFFQLDNASVDTRERTNERSPFVLELAERPAQTTVSAAWITPGAFLVRLVVEDDCGAWQTFVGAGPNAF